MSQNNWFLKNIKVHVHFENLIFFIKFNFIMNLKFQQFIYSQFFPNVGNILNVN